MAQLVKNPPAMQDTWVQSLGWEDALRRKWQPTPVFLPGEFHGRGALWATIHGVTESETTERLSFSLDNTILFLIIFLLTWKELEQVE